MDTEKSLRWIAVITAEKVDKARRELGLGETATLEEVKNRFKELAKRWHPDVCVERDPIICQDRFRRITDAKTLLSLLIHLYNYSFRPENIERDQEKYDIRFLRQFRSELSTHLCPNEDLLESISRKHRFLITVENIQHAKEILGISDIASKVQVEFAYQIALQRFSDSSENSKNESKTDTLSRPEIKWAYQLITKYIDQYRYSFRASDIHAYQEDAIERHRRQFGNEPMWAGGEYDDRVSI